VGQILYISPVGPKKWQNFENFIFHQKFEFRVSKSLTTVEAAKIERRKKQAKNEMPEKENEISDEYNKTLENLVDTLKEEINQERDLRNQEIGFFIIF